LNHQSFGEGTLPATFIDIEKHVPFLKLT